MNTSCSQLNPRMTYLGLGNGSGSRAKYEPENILYSWNQETNSDLVHKQVFVFVLVDKQRKDHFTARHCQT
jgi:hypothetical protein